MRRIAGLMLVASIAAWLTASLPSVASAGQRATLTWDTDQTDVDLHIWDEFGNHAWYADQSGIPDAQLSTDIRYGFGPEDFEEFEGAEGRNYTYGICYYASNRADGVVPDTTATVTLTDPDGTQRTLRRVLHSEGEAYYLGTSPFDAPPFVPTDDWCRGSTDGPYHAAEDSGPDPTGGGGCTRTRRRIGVVDLCADEVTGSGPEYVASGDVRADGGVSLGDGPFTLDTASETISGDGVVQVLRGASAIPIVAGSLSIDASGTTEPVSGRTGTAAVDVSGATAQLGALKVAGLPLTAGPVSGSSLTLNLDPADGGGVIAQGGVQLPFAGGASSGASLAVGVHSASHAAVRVLGGNASFAHVTLPGGWALGPFTLSYDEASDSWHASGGLTTPAFGLDLSGGLADGQLDALGLTIARDVPLGTSGFILTKLGGSVKGLARPPLEIAATASGKWGSVPGLRGVGLILFQDVTLTVNLSGSASLDGRVEFIKDGSPVHGRMTLTMRLSPFTASGRLEASARFGPLGVDADGGVAFTSSAFTAAGGARGTLFGTTIADGREVVSDTGVGVTGSVCFVSIFHRCAGQATLGVGMRWDEFPHVRVIGGDVQQFVTVSRAGGSRAIAVAPGRPFLIVQASGPVGAVPAFSLVDPAGRTIGTRRATARTRVVHDRADGYAAVLVLSPRPGRWRVVPGGRGHRTRFSAQTVHRIRRVHVVRLAPAGGRAHPVSRRHGAVQVSWRSSGLPRDARVAVYVTRRPGQLGTRVGRGLRANGSLRIRGRALSRGVNRVRLVVSVDGVPADDVLAPRRIIAR